jgi:lipoate---protein ligase
MSSAFSTPTHSKSIPDCPVQPYSLPDLAFFHSRETELSAMCWVPDRRIIVLGRGSQPEKAFFPEEAARRNVPVMRRPSGGETVLLSPQTILIAAVRDNVKLQSPHRFFEEFNRRVISALRSCGVKNLNQKGTSDICIGEKKILGSSIYWHRKKLLYHAVLNVGEPIQNMDILLKHPPRAPEYRKGRSHSEFVTSLRSEGCTTSMEILQKALISELISPGLLNGAARPARPLLTAPESY